LVLKVNNVQMKLKAFNILTVAAIITSGTFVSCVADDNSPGLEYMPDMYRSPAVEAYVDYGEVEGRYDEDAQTMVEKKFSYLPPLGTVPYTTDGNFLAPYSHGGPLNVNRTHGLYEVDQDTAGLAMAKLDVNPIAWSEEVVGEGKVLYERFCIHCHGDKGDGQGTVVQNSNGKYPPPGAYKKEMAAGEMVYIMTYGKGQMGSHASQVNLEDRWILAHYIQKLAGVEQGVQEEVAPVDENAVEGELEAEVIQEVHEAAEEVSPIEEH
jgi:mono/diheme cytochrome c family protein